MRSFEANTTGTPSVQDQIPGASIGVSPISNVSFEDHAEPFGRGLLHSSGTFNAVSVRPLETLRRDPPEDDRPHTVRPGIGFDDGITYTTREGDEFQVEGDSSEIRIGYKKRFN